MHNNCRVLAKRGVWPDDPHTNQVTAQKARPHAQSYNKRLLLVDLICILLVSIPFFVCETNIVEPIHVGFFCNDNSIHYPLKVQSIDSIILICTGLFISIASITLGEIQWLRCQQVTSPVLVSSTYMTVIYRELSAFLFGFTMNQSLTSIAKIFTGHLRPNFLAVCRPALAHLKCTHGYITHYNCTGASAEVSQARKSFFSDHAAFSAYCVIYLMAFFISDMFLSKKSLPPVSSSCSESQDLGEQTSC